MKKMTNKKKVEFRVKGNGDTKSTMINIASTKKRINFDSEFDRDLDVYKACLELAIKKLYGGGKYFIQDNSGVDGRGQIWQASPTGGSDSVTGVICIEDGFFI